MIRGFHPALAGVLGWTLMAAGPGLNEPQPGLTTPQWREVVPGIEFARVEALRYCRSGSSRIAVVRLDPSRSRIEPYHEREFPREPRAAAGAWHRRLGAPVILNAGLYDDGRRHLGVLRRDGDDVGGLGHPSWKGILVSGGTGGLPAAAVLDLGVPEDRAQSERYPHAVQSMMLVDRRGEVRVRRSDKIARRSAVAQDAGGRLYFFVTEGSFTLWETGALLREAQWDLICALALDGGNEAQLAVESTDVRYHTGRRDESSAEDPLGAPVTLPSVLAVWPRGE